MVIFHCYVSLPEGILDLRSGRRNTSERIERTYSTPQEVIGAPFFFSLSLWSLSEMFWPKTQNLLNLSLTQFLICCVWRSQILRHWRIIDDLLARNLRPRNNQWDPENWNQCILWPPDPPDRQGSQDTSGHQDTSSDHFIESEDLDGKPSETATVWKRSRKCRRVAWKKELQRFIGTSLGEWQIRENQKQNCQSWSKTDQTQSALECIFM